MNIKSEYKSYIHFLSEYKLCCSSSDNNIAGTIPEDCVCNSYFLLRLFFLLFFVCVLLPASSPTIPEDCLCHHHHSPPQDDQHQNCAHHHQHDHHQLTVPSTDHGPVRGSVLGVVDRLDLETDPSKTRDQICQVLTFLKLALASH